jgi:purine nucleoside phosphorylase
MERRTRADSDIYSRGNTDQPLTHAEVMENGNRVKSRFIALLRAVIPHIAADVAAAIPDG